MDALGYSLTWKTKCFIGPGCGTTVFAHTNGYGDFVLFDKLGWPWPVHDCYFNNFGHHVHRSRAAPYDGAIGRSWDSITPISADANGPRKRYSFVGTVTNIEEGFLGKSEEFRRLSNAANAEVKGVLGGRHSLITIVTGDGAEFTAFIDIDKSPAHFRDIIACDLKAVELFNKSVFVVTQVNVFRSSE